MQPELVTDRNKEKSRPSTQEQNKETNTEYLGDGGVSI